MFKSLTAFALVLVLGSAVPALATDIHVTTTDDGSVPGECTLRDAIIASNTDTAVAGCPAGSDEDVIQLQHDARYELTGGDLEVGPGEPPIRGSLKIQGHGSTIDAMGNDRVFASTYTSLDLNDLTITGGNGWTSGGGIIAAFGRLTGHDVRVVGNRAVFGGGIYLVANSQYPLEAELNGWTISDNTAAFWVFGDGGGLWAALGKSGGSITLRHCIVSGNSARRKGGGIGLDSLGSSGDRLRIVSSTISENTTAGQGGGLWARTNNNDSFLQLDLRNSTVAGNTSDGDGGGLFLHGRRGSFEATIGQGSIDGNTAQNGGGIAAVGAQPDRGDGLVLTVRQTTVSGNQAVPSSDPQTGSGGGVLNSDAEVLLDDVVLTGNVATGDPDHGQGVGGAVLNAATGNADGTAFLSLSRTRIHGNDASLGDGVATVSVHPSFTAQTTFRRTSICEEADTCVSDISYPTEEISLGWNEESDDRCGFSAPTDEVMAACAEEVLPFGLLDRAPPATRLLQAWDEDEQAVGGILPEPSTR